VDILNEYFRRMNAVITCHHGHINELVGDGLLALFGALEHNPWQGRDAVLAALDMRAELARYNEELRAKSLPNCGSASVSTARSCGRHHGRGSSPQQVYRHRRSNQRCLPRRGFDVGSQGGSV